MNKEDYLSLLKAAGGLVELDHICYMLTQTCLSGEKIECLNQVWDVLRRNAGKKFQNTEDMEESEDRFNLFHEIIENEKLSLEEKYERLMAD